MSIHISAQVGEIAPYVLMPGDPLRAKKMSEKFLENPKLVSSVRNCLYYTGTYQGVAVTIGASGMGEPSIGIYSYELYDFYDVDLIIRLGTCGSFETNVKVHDVVLVAESFSHESCFAKVFLNSDTKCLKTNLDFNNLVQEVAQSNDIPVSLVRSYCSSTFYGEDKWKEWKEKDGCQVAEMEASALIVNSIVCKKKAACLLTVSDSFVTDKHLTSQQKEDDVCQMFELVLKSVVAYHHQKNNNN